MNGLLKKVNLRGWLNLVSRVRGANLVSNQDAASSPASLQSLHLSPKTQKLLTPKKARRQFNKTISELARDGYVRILTRRLYIATGLFLFTATAWALREAFR